MSAKKISRKTMISAKNGPTFLTIQKTKSLSETWYPKGSLVYGSDMTWMRTGPLGVALFQDLPP